MRYRFGLGAGLLALAAISPAFAFDPSTASAFAHVGLGYVKQADSATLYMLGTPVPGAGFSTEGRMITTIEGGLFLKGGFAIAASGTSPMTTPNMATGTISAFGNLGDETASFYSLTAQYHLALTDRFTPYVGAGASYMHVHNTVDGAVSGMHVDDAVGTVIQAGVDFAVTDNIGVFADVKRYFISTSASGTLLGNAITADARVDPWIVSSGLSIGF